MFHMSHHLSNYSQISDPTLIHSDQRDDMLSNHTPSGSRRVGELWTISQKAMDDGLVIIFKR